MMRRWRFRHHHHHHHRHGHVRLHRRLFWAFGAAILLTGASVMVVTKLFGDASWRRELRRVSLFVGSRFEHVWDNPRERHELARSMSEDLELSIVLLERDGRRIAGYGDPECRKGFGPTPVMRNGEPLGYVRICIERAHARGPLRAVLAICLAASLLWALAGRFARRLTRPLAELENVARDIGQGRLSSRAHMSSQQTDEVGVLARAFNTMAERIERQMSDQRELLAAVSHELRTPLARIRLLVELARGKGVEEKTLDEVDREVVEIDALVGELLASSRLDFAAIVPRHLNAVELAARALERAGLPEERLKAEAKEMFFEGDPTLIARALANLIDNAQKHGEGLTALALSFDGSDIRISAEDEGAGLLPGDDVRVFERFYRGGAPRERDKGSLGLGLALVKRIAEAHNGRVHAQNRTPRGAEVGFRIPKSGQKPT